MTFGWMGKSALTHNITYMSARSPKIFTRIRPEGVLIESFPNRMKSNISKWSVLLLTKLDGAFLKFLLRTVSQEDAAQISLIFIRCIDAYYYAILLNGISALLWLVMLEIGENTMCLWRVLQYTSCSLLWVVFDNYCYFVCQFIYHSFLQANFDNLNMSYVILIWYTILLNELSFLLKSILFHHKILCKRQLMINE